MNRLASSPGLVVEAVVEERLAAAGLGLGEVHAAAEMLQDLRHRDADVGVELVGQAGDEQGDVGGHEEGILGNKRSARKLGARTSANVKRNVKRET